MSLKGILNVDEDVESSSKSDCNLWYVLTEMKS